MKLTCRKTKKTIAACLAALLALSLAACGKGEKKSDQPADGDAFVYVPRYISLTSGEQERVNNYCEAGGKFYYTAYTYDETAGMSGETLYRYDIAADSKEEIKLEEPGTEESSDRPSVETPAGSEADQPAAEEPAGGSNNTYLQRIAADSQGNVYLLYMQYSYDENNPENQTRNMLLVKRDASGKAVYTQDITENLSGDGYVDRVAADAEGKVYILGSVEGSQSLLLYDTAGGFAGAVECKDTWVSALAAGGDGRIYIAYNDYKAEKDELVIAPVDFQGKKLGDAYRLPGSGSGMAAGGENAFLMWTESKLSTYDTKSGAVEELLQWLDCDINGTYVQSASAAGDGKILAYINNWDTDTSELVILTRTKASEVAKREEITIGTFGTSQELRAAAVGFNKSNEKYRVKLKEYWDYASGVEYKDAIAKMNTDLLSDSCPDMLAISGTELNLPELAAKGVFADLNGFLDKSTGFKREDFVESVLRSATYNDTLVAIPKSFTLMSMAGKTSQVGDRKGWTIKDVIDFAAQYPDAELLEYTSRDSVLRAMLMFNQSVFVDREKGTCSFNTEEFKQILEFAGKFPEEVGYDGENRPSTPARLASGDLLLYADSVSQVEEIQLVEAMFGEPVTWIGYPTTDGRPGCVMIPSESYAILSRSEKQEGAWAFIESSLNTESARFSWGLPSRKDQLEEKIKKGTEVEYLLDENGEKVLDEKGEPIIQGGSGIGFGDWGYTYRACTEAEIATLRELIDLASPLPYSDSEILKIVTEEAASYFKGQKSLDQVADTIQSRASMYVGENN